MTRIYVAGPMRGYPDLNFPAFRAVTKHLREKGFEVVSPVEVGESWAGEGNTSHPPEKYLRKDLEVLITCNAIACLFGWENSVGARCEVAVALSLGFQFYTTAGDLKQAPTAVLVSGGYKR